MNLDAISLRPLEINHMTLSPNNLKLVNSSFSTSNQKKQSIKLNSFRNPINLSNRTLIIIPGYSISNPPRIGDHRFYIDALKFHPEKNPYGYKRIYLFDLYSNKDGRCNFKYDIPTLADELYASINDSSRDNWQFVEGGDIDFIAASMGGLILRSFVQKYLIGENKIETARWGALKITTAILIGTPNFGCSIVDRLQAPFIQFLLRLLFGKNNFSTSEQVNQISIGNFNIFGRILSKLLRKTTPKNEFLEALNSQVPTPGSIRWITLRGTKRTWFSSFLYSRKIENDGVIAASSVSLPKAENIADKDFQMNLSWDHRDLYQHESVCKLLYGLLVMNLKLDDYIMLRQLMDAKSIVLDQISGAKNLAEKLILK